MKNICRELDNIAYTEKYGCTCQRRMKSERTQGERSLIWTPSATPAGQKEASHPGWQECHVPLANKRTLSDISAYTHNIIYRTSCRILFPVIFRNQLLSACHGYLRTL